VRLRLIGPPHVFDDDGPRPVRGHQVWAVLARVLLAERPLTRSELAAELFPGTADPLGSLRWCLAAARRVLDAPNALTGDPISFGLPDGLTVDLLDLLDGQYVESEVGDLLEGVVAGHAREGAGAERQPVGPSHHGRGNQPGLEGRHDGDR